MNELTKHVESLVAQAAATRHPEEAMRFSQAALNAAHALNVLKQIKADLPDK